MFLGAPFAKYLPLDPIDFEAREGIPWSGWPFGRIALESCYRRAQAVCGLAPFDSGGPTGSDVAAPRLALTSGALVQSVYQYGPADRFTVVLPAELMASSSVTWLHGATVTALEATDAAVVANAVAWKHVLGAGETRTYSVAGRVDREATSRSLAVTACVHDRLNAGRLI